MESFWTSTRRWDFRRTAFLGAVGGAGAETYDWSCAELRKMDAMICRFLRMLLMRKAQDGARKGRTNKEVLKFWRVALMNVEIAVRRTAWLQAMLKSLQEHAQVTTAVWGTMLTASPLDSVGRSRLGAHRYARMFHGGLQLYKGISGKVTFLRLER